MFKSVNARQALPLENEAFRGCDVAKIRQRTHWRRK